MYTVQVSRLIIILTVVAVLAMYTVQVSRLIIIITVVVVLAMYMSVG